MKINSFKELPIWKLSISVTSEIYKITSSYVFAKDFGLRDQLRRAIVSVSSNIAEGFEKNNNNEFIHYLKIAKGSVGEVKSQLYTAYKISYLICEDYNRLSDLLESLSRQIGGFIKYLSNKRENKQFIKH